MCERILSINGADLWLAEQGQGSPIMLSNGGPGCCDYLGPVAAMIDDLARVYRWEQRGCGRSSPAPPYDLDTCLADLDGLRRALGHDRWIIGGHSWGANLSLAYALTYPQHTRAVLYLSGNGFQSDRDWHAVYSKGRDEGHELLPNFAYPPNLDVNRQVNASWKRFIQEPHLWRRLAGLDVPVLAICGSEDIRPNWPVQQIVNLMPNARFALIEGAGHHSELTHPG
ncbi:MAG: alpha/beta fold hydrolase, partial [Dehalococcoidia bacterium]